MNILFIVNDLNSGSGECVRSIIKKWEGANVTIITTTSTPSGNWHNANIISIPHKINEALYKYKIVLLYFVWPLNSFLFKKMYLKGKEIIESNDIDIVIPVYNTIDALIAGHLLKRKYTDRIKYIPYFLDAFYAGQCPRFMPQWLKKRLALWWERYLLKNADRVIMMDAVKNVYNTDLINEQYVKKVVFLDLPLYNPQQYKFKKEFFPCDQIVLLYAGSMPRNIRNPLFFLKLANQICVNDIHLYIAGSSEYQSLVEEFAQLNNNIHLLGVIDHDKINTLLGESDVVINIGNSLSYMVPCKLFEYMSYGKPIISTYRIDDDPCRSYLDKYKYSLQLDERQDFDIQCNRSKDFLMSLSRETVMEKDSTAFINNRPETFIRQIEEFNK